MSKIQLTEWVDLALQNEDICNHTFTIDGKNGKGEGYMGDIFFVSVTGKNKTGQIKVIKLVIKASKQSKALRQQTPIKQAFEKEIFFYEHILREFKIFQKEMKAENLLNYLPLCYVSRIANDSELLILEDLKSQGYGTWDRRKPMTEEHVRLVLEAYGKWHAFSFAMKKKKNEVFKDLVKNNVNMYSYFFVKTRLVDVVFDLYVNGKDACIEKDEIKMLNLLEISEQDGHYIMNDLYFEDPEYSVITHGDCWTNNYLFKCDKYKTKPIGVMVLDWQCGGLSSPVFDLSQFIYSCVDTAAFKDVSSLLKIYYKSLSKTLEFLSCTPEEIFPYFKLIEHWKKFSRYGIFLHCFIISLALCDTEDAPDYAEAAEEGKDFLQNFDIKITDKEDYYKRIRANFVHYVTNLEI